MNVDPDDKPSAHLALQQMIESFRVSQLIYVAAELGVADLLKDGPKDCSELAATCNAHPHALARLMRALAALGIFAESEEGRFELNPLADHLRRDHPSSLKARAVFHGSQHYPAWGHLLHSIKTGETAFDHLHGMNVWQYRAQNPLARQTFDEGLAGRADQFARAVIQAYDFSRYAKIVDIGGGSGILLAAILGANPRARGILFELGEAISNGRGTRSIELGERCEFVAGDFLERVAAGGDLYLLSRVIHDWDDANAVKILKNCERVMQRNHRLVIIERVIDPNKPSAETALADINMMVMNGGCERTLAQYQALLHQSGFEFTNDVMTHAEVHIIDAQPAREDAK